MVEVIEELYQPGRIVRILPADEPEIREGD
jgi:hypothetical protein